eukprot:5441913-Lingulodinium_polyedra.AAC.1
MQRRRLLKLYLTPFHLFDGETLVEQQAMIAAAWPVFPEYARHHAYELSSDVLVPSCPKPYVRLLLALALRCLA